MNDSKDPARGYFEPTMTDAERACFEAGIAISTLYHRLIGLPVRDDRKQLRTIERALEESIRNQPFRKSVSVKIKPRGLTERAGEYGYGEVTGEWLSLEVVISYGSSKAVAQMSFADELNYPLMFVSGITRGGRSGGQRIRRTKE